jgi:putative glycosyltransferase
MLISLLAAGTAIWLLIIHFLGFVQLSGWISVMLSVWFIGGVLIFCVGVIGIYVSKIFIETKRRPYTIVRNLHNFGIPVGQRADRETE